jgi:Phage capsid family
MTAQNLVQHTARVARDVETKANVREFVALCKCLMLGGSVTKAAELAREFGPRAGPHVTNILENTLEVSHKQLRAKAATDVGSISGWGSPLANFELLSNSFLASLAPISLFDALLPSMLQLPLRTKVTAVSTVLSASSLPESGVKRASSIAVTGSDLEATKAAAFVAVTAELLKHSPLANAVLQAELRRAISRATNAIFLPLLVAGASVASSGSNANAVRQDLRTLLASVTSGADSKLFLITTRTIVEALSVLGDSQGGPGFPTVTVDGGSIGGMTVIPCDEVTAGEIILVDASQVAAGSDGLVLDSSTEASVHMDTAPDSPPGAASAYVSLWQLNLVALRAERYIGAKVLRSDAVAKITGVGYTGGSPA